MSKENVTKLITAVGVSMFVLVILITGITRCSKSKDKTSENVNDPTAVSSEAVDTADAHTRIEKMVSKVPMATASKSKAPVDYSDNTGANLPNIDTKYPMTVTSDGDIIIEIFSTSEKAGKGNNGWLNEMAEEFNKQGFKTSSGKSGTISIRSIASGAASDYIANKVYVPQAYTPSNELFGELANQSGAKLTLVEKQLVDNTAGIAISKSGVDTVKEKYGELTSENVITAVLNGDIQMGYTYPYTSATGLNFLVTALQTFDNNEFMSAAATEKFQQFQNSIPFICYTTDQMVNAMNSGTLQAGVTEYQAYLNSTTLNSTYEFVPFGYKHSNPLYKVGDLNAEQEEVLNSFAEFLMSTDSQKKAQEYGFKPYNYSYNTKEITGADLVRAQSLWKKEKSSGVPTIAVFVADTSGSMQGDPIQRLKMSLTEASKTIGSDNYVGLVSYSDDVIINLPVGKFDLEQRGYFAGAVNNMKANGGTATYNAMLVAMDMLLTAKEEVGEANLMLFVLSDGEQNVGYSYEDITDIVKQSGIPVYTIGYNEELPVFKDLSGINEAVYINANSDDVIYELSALFNAQM